MIKVKVDIRKAFAAELEMITSGSVGMTAEFEFSPEWDGLSRAVVFSDGVETRDMTLQGNKCEIPHECVAVPGRTLRVGAYGTLGSDIVIPTIWCSLGTIRTGTSLSGDPSIPPTPSVVDQILSAATSAVEKAQSVVDAAERGDFDGEPGPAGPQGPQGPAGTSDHAQLTNRDAANQHTIFSITNLQQTLNSKQPIITDIDTIRSNAESGAQTPAVAARVAAVEEVIPEQASAENKLADKAFVNSTLQTSTANFRGNWSTWADVPIDANDYPADYLGIKTPSVNDYLVVVDASDYSASAPISGTWRFKYSGVWATDGKSGWHKEYQVNESPMTAAQLAALNSGATAARFGTIESALNNTELWTFTLDDDTVVTKRVVVKSES